MNLSTEECILTARAIEAENCTNTGITSRNSTILLDKTELI